MTCAPMRLQSLKHSAINNDPGLPGTNAAAIEAFMATLDARVRQMLNP